MQRLTDTEQAVINGGGRLTHSLQAAACATLGLSIGATIGTQCGHFLGQSTPIGYVDQLKNYAIDAAINHKMGSYGVHNMRDFTGGFIGSLIGCIGGAALFGGFIP